MAGADVEVRLAGLRLHQVIKELQHLAKAGYADATVEWINDSYILATKLRVTKELTGGD